MASQPSERAVRRVAFNTAVQIGARAVGAILGLAQIVVLTHYLHSTRYGEYAFVLSTVGLGAVLSDLGLNAVSVRRFSEGRLEARSTTLGALLSARTFLAALILIVTDVAALFVPLPDVERKGILLITLGYVLNVPLGAFSLFQSELELHFPLAISALQLVIALLLSVALVLLHATVLVFLAVQLVTSALASGATLALATRRYDTGIKLDLGAGFQMVREALPVGIGLALVTIYFRIDSVLLGLMKGSVAVAHYVGAYKFVDVGSFAAGALMATVYPLMARKGGDEERRQLRYAYQASTEVMIFLGLPLAVGTAFLARPLIQLIYPGDFAPAIGALQILSVVIPLLFFNNVLGPLVLTLHREKQFLWVAFGATVLNIGLNLAFIPRFGILAASVVTVVSELFVTVVGAYLMGRVLVYVPSLRPLLLSAAAVVVMLVPLYLLRHLWPLAAVFAGLAYLAAARLLGFTSPFDLALVALRPSRAR